MWLSPFDYHCVFLDGALPGIKELWYRYAKDPNSTEHLYLKTKHASLIEVSPLIGRTGFDDPFLPQLYKAVAQNKVASNWGCLLHTAASLEELARHFRKWITIYNDIGEEVFFRFYDPDILPHFADALEGDEKQFFFGPVNAFIYRQNSTDLLAASEAKRPENFAYEEMAAKLPDTAPWFISQERHITKMLPLFISILAEDILQPLILHASYWIMHLKKEELLLRVEECLHRLSALQQNTLPADEDALAFCLLAITSCSHFDASPEFGDCVRKLGVHETLMEWKKYSYAPISGLEHRHNPAWLPSAVD